MIKDVPVREIMVSPVVTVYVNEPLSHVEEKLRRKGIRHVPVVDEYEHVVGLMSQRDLYRILSPHITDAGLRYDEEALNTFVLKHVMTKNPLTLRQEDTLSKAVDVMARLKYGCCPVVDSFGKIIGIVTESDVLKYLAKQFY